MGDYQAGTVYEFSDLSWIDRLARNHGVIDAGQLGDLGRNWYRGLAQHLEGRLDFVNAAAGPAICKRYEGNLDDLVLTWVEARSFKIKEDRGTNDLVARHRHCGPRLEPSQNPVVARRLEDGDGVFDRWFDLLHGYQPSENPRDD